MALFSRGIAVHFSDTDPAGILFYPRYLEMANALIEDWFAEELGYPFSALYQGAAYSVPTLSLNFLFSTASRIADFLRLTLGVAHLGKISFTLDISTACGKDAKSALFPTKLRERMARFLTLESTD